MNLKKIAYGMILATAVVAMAGCGKDKSNKDGALAKVTLGDYKGIEVEKTSTEPTEEAIKEQINQYLQTQKSGKKIVKKGDIVNIDYVGKINGKKFDGGEATGFNLEIGSKSFIDTFEEQLIGKSVGKKYKVKVTFPKDYHQKDYQGKKAEFDVKINYICADKLTDNMVKADKSLNCDNVKEYKAYVKKQLKEQLESTAENTMKTQVLETAVKNAKFDDLTDDINKDVEKTIKQLKDTYNLTLEQYAQQMGTDEKTVRKQIEDSSKSYVQQGLVLLAIAEKENITLKDDEFDSKVQKTIDEYAANGNKITKDELYEQTGGKEETRKYFLQLEALDFLVKQAKIVEPKETAKDTEKAKK